MPNLPRKDSLLAFFEEYYPKSFKTKEIARLLALPKQGDEYQHLKNALRELQNTGQIERVNGNKWMLKRAVAELIGQLRLMKNGHGTVTSESDPTLDVFVHRRNLNEAEEGDRVRVFVAQRPDRKEQEGEIVEVLERPVVRKIGTVRKIRNAYFYEDDAEHHSSLIPLPSAKLSGAKDGDRVVIESASIGLAGRVDAKPEVVEVLGREGNPDAELMAVARRYGLRSEFPVDVETEAAAIPVKIPEEEIAGRLDLRETTLFTIDPEDAKDFDDAVSIEITPEGDYKLGVHIADVSYYVPEGGALDREALNRGTSVYMVNIVFPMLPERLSNHLCSLQEGKDRLAFSAFMTVSPRGKVKEHSFHRSVIRSKKRFTYQAAQAILDAGEGEFADVLKTMNALAVVLTKKRIREGAIDFDVPEMKFVLSPSGYPEDIVVKPRIQTMRLIEEFMLLANKTVALAFKTDREQLPFLYRVHDLPDPDKIRELTDFLKHLRIRVNLDPKSSKSFQQMIESLGGKPEASVVQSVAIRTMARAEYSEKNIGHFGLGFSHYTHFTSPIRRYPDLVVHRLLAELIAGNHARIHNYGKSLREMAKQSSVRERVGVEAERDAIKVKQVEFMRRHLGMEFDAVINGVMHYGLYVQTLQHLVEGLVHVRTLDDDYYEFDAKGRRLVGRRKKKTYELGGKLRIQVVRVDPLEMRIDFNVVE